MQTMASPTDVKHYLAYWFQLGKQVLDDDGQTRYKTKTVIQGDRFSPEFERCWQSITQKSGESLYLEGTDETIAELLSPAWEMTRCARCEMPVPVPKVEHSVRPCPCNDLPSWPNEEIPMPRLPISTHHQLNRLREQLIANLQKD